MYIYIYAFRVVIYYETYKYFTDAVCFQTRLIMNYYQSFSRRYHTLCYYWTLNRSEKWLSSTKETAIDTPYNIFLLVVLIRFLHNFFCTNFLFKNFQSFVYFFFFLYILWLSTVTAAVAAALVVYFLSFGLRASW